MWRPVGALGEEYSAHAARPARCVEPTYDIVGVRLGDPLPFISHSVQREKPLDVVDRADHDLAFGLADMRADCLAKF